MTAPSPPTGVIDFFTHPPLVALSTAFDENGPYTGNNTLTHWGQGPAPIITQRLVSQSFGVVVQLSGAIPISWGFTNGWVSDDGLYDESSYFPPLGQLVAQHQLRDGSWITTQKVLIDGFPRQMLWDEAFPGRLGLLVAPHIALDLIFYIVA